MQWFIFFLILENEHLNAGRTKFLNTGSMCCMKLFLFLFLNKNDCFVFNFENKQFHAAHNLVCTASNGSFYSEFGK